MATFNAVETRARLGSSRVAAPSRLVGGPASVVARAAVVYEGNILGLILHNALPIWPQFKLGQSCEANSELAQKVAKYMRAQKMVHSCLMNDVGHTNVRLSTKGLV